MALTVNQILVIGLILVLIAFAIVFANMGVNAVKLIKEIKKLVGNANNMVDGSKEIVKNVGDSITTTANKLVEDSDTTTKVVSVAASGIIATSLVSGIIKRMLGKRSKKAKKQLKKSEKDLKSARKAAKKARKISRKAGKVVKLGL